MIDSAYLSLLGTPLSITLSVLIAITAGTLGVLAWRRSGYRPAIAGLECLRFVIVVLVCVILNQPEWVQLYRPQTKPTIAVLVDQSASMQTRDATSNSADETSPISRAESIAKLTSEEAYRGLSDRMQVIVQPFSGASIASQQSNDSGSNVNQESAALNEPSETSTGSDLHRPLMETATKVNDLLGVVLISDGDWNEGVAPVEAATRLRMKNVPIFTVAAGNAQRLPDVELVHVDLPTFAPVGKIVRVPITIDSALPRDFTTTVTLTTANGETVSKEVRVDAMGRTSDALMWKPQAAGDQAVTVSIPTQPGETISDNNQRTAPIAIRDESLKVLVVESYPRWEYRYLRNALSRDPGIDVSCLLFHPNLSKVGGGSQDYIKAFPSTIEELSKYDVVFLGDVGISSEQLTMEQCELLRGLVEQQAAGLVFLPGWQGRQSSLMQTPLEPLCPIVWDDSQPEGWGSRDPGHFELTTRGRDSLLTKLADGGDANAEVWENLPGFQWYAPVVRAKAGTEVLAVHGEMSNQYGRLPLLVTRTYGAGKVLFMGTDGAWRWRKGVEDKYHYRFWGQVVRWMAYQRNMAKGETMRLYYTPDQPAARQTLTLHAHVMDAGGEPLQQGDVVAQITAPSGKIETVRMSAEDDQWGVFQGSTIPAEPGKHTVVLACAQTDAELQTSFFVQGQPLEQVGRPARPEVLRELSLVSGGQMVEPDQLDQVIQMLAELPLPPPVTRRLQLWSHPLTAALLITLLTAFWIWRKAVGLV